MTAENKREYTDNINLEKLRKHYSSYIDSPNIEYETRRNIIDLIDEVERLASELKTIGDMAVTDWNDTVVGMVDKSIKTYANKVQCLREEMKGLKDENRSLKGERCSCVCKKRGQ